MKILHTLLIAGLMTFAAGAGAQEAYKLQLRATSLSTNEAGEIIKKTVTHESLIRDYAHDNNITNKSDLQALTLVYRVNGDLNGDTLEIVNRDTGDTVATLLKFLHVLWGTTFESPDGRGREQFSGIFQPAGGDAIGSAVIHTKFSPKGKTRLDGSFNFMFPAEDTNSTQIVTGTFNSSKLLE